MRIWEDCIFFWVLSLAFFVFNVHADFLTRYMALDFHGNCCTCHFIIFPPQLFCWEARVGRGRKRGEEKDWVRESEGQKGREGWEVKDDMRASKFVILGIYLFIKNWSYSLSFCCGCNFIPPESNCHSYTLPLGKERQRKVKKDRYFCNQKSQFIWWTCGVLACEVCNTEMASDKFAKWKCYQRRSSHAAIRDCFSVSLRWRIIGQHIWKLVHHGACGDPVYTSMAQRRRPREWKVLPKQEVRSGKETR